MQRSTQESQLASQPSVVHEGNRLVRTVRLVPGQQGVEVTLAGSYRIALASHGKPGYWLSLWNPHSFWLPRCPDVERVISVLALRRTVVALSGGGHGADLCS